MAKSEEEHLLNQLRDAHAIEVQALRQLERAAQTSGDSDLYEEHLEQTKEHEEKVRELVEANGHEPSPIEDKTLRGGAIGLRQMADVPLDTPVRTAMNLYALEHLEIATYGLLAELARALDKDDVAHEADRILQEEEAAAEKIEGTFDSAVDRLLEKAREDEDGDAEVDDSDLLVAHLRDVHALEEQSLALLRMGLEEMDQDEALEAIYREHLEQTEEHEKLVNERLEDREVKPSAVRDLHMGAATAGLRDVTAGPRMLKPSWP